MKTAMTPEEFKSALNQAYRVKMTRQGADSYQFYLGRIQPEVSFCQEIVARLAEGRFTVESPGWINLKLWRWFWEYFPGHDDIVRINPHLEAYGLKLVTIQFLDWGVLWMHTEYRFERLPETVILTLTSPDGDVELNP